MIEKPILWELKATFIQDGNTLGTTDETERLEIRLERQDFDEDDPFWLVIKSETGWSFGSPEELAELIEKMKQPTER